MMNYNMFGNYSFGRTPQQLQQEYSNLMQQYQNLYGANNQQNQSLNISSNIPSTNGTYTKVSSYNEVENFPTSTDGTATLFFDFEHGVFWSKKFVNGQHTIQAFTFRPLNQNADAQKTETNIVKEVAREQTEMVTEPSKEDIYYNELSERLEKLETKVSKLSNTQSRSNKSRIIKDEVLI